MSDPHSDTPDRPMPNLGDGDINVSITNVLTSNVSDINPPSSKLTDPAEILNPLPLENFQMQASPNPVSDEGALSPFEAKSRLWSALTTKYKWLKWMVFGGAGCGLLGIVMVAGILIWAGQDLPDTRPLWETKTTPSIRVVDRHGREILTTGGREAVRVELDKMPVHLVDALIAIEDKRFYYHYGFDVIGLSRALMSNVRAGRVVQGGSTITQQLAKNVFLTREQTLKRKIQELMLSVWLERRMTKREILQTYLGRVYFGGGTVGIHSGAKRFFNKNPQALTLGETALLVGLLQAPDRLNPVKNLNSSSVRTAQVLREMHAQGKITDAVFSAAMQDPIMVEPVQVRAVASSGYFSDWILREVADQIGKPNHDIIVRTSLDLDHQGLAQKAVSGGVSERRNAQQAALIAYDGTGGIRAMVGGVNYQHSPFNRAVQANRQPGSAFKPFVFLAAVRAGLSPWDVRDDAPIDIDGWKPGNFSNKFTGPMSLEKALSGSINSIAVILGEEVGREQVVKAAASMGLTGFKAYASLALGAQETNLYQLTAGYIPFANWGYEAKPYGLVSIHSADGSVLYRRQNITPQKILNTDELGKMNRMLRSVVQNGTGRAARLRYQGKTRPIGGKTGTTNDYRDAWFVGYSGDFITGVWVGNDDNSKMAKITGGQLPARIWKTFMSDILEDQPIVDLPNVQKPIALANDDRLDMLLSDVEKSLQ